MTRGQMTDTYLTLDEAWRYVKAKSVAAFQSEVRKGIWPQPCVRSRPPRWYRPALDKAAAGMTSSEDEGEAQALAAVERRRYGR